MLLLCGAGACAALCLALYAWLPAKGSERRYTAFDQLIADWLKPTVSGMFTAYGKFLTIIGSTGSVIGITVILTLVAIWLVSWKQAVWLPVSVALAYGVNTWIKNSVVRPRPEKAWGIEAAGYSFPSTNAATAMALYLLFAFIVWRSERLKPAVKLFAAVLCGVLIISTGWSRLYFSVHYATDVLAGFAVGGAVVLTIAAFTKART
ncbi:phosphatase PAP2 family protein [Paenibacillus tarimensis]